MAPKKRRTDEEEPVKPNTMSSRVTRSSTRRVNGSTPADSVVPSELPKKKKVKTSSKEKGKVDESAKAEATVAKFVHGSKTIVIEHCKQCNSFKTRAIQVKNGLENGLSGVTVHVNPEKPRRGCFEIREEGGETFISLLDMKRPFAPMKALDMDKVISDIIDKIKC
uniref:Putative selenoprotein H n=1 Tax=Davidia involucrata TaxID=16924 RepID=A0A5B7BKC1_DAVIN